MATRKLSRHLLSAHGNLSNPLYHGMIMPFARIDVSRGKGRRDFGRGFYMAVSASHAIGMMHKKYREAASRRRDIRTDDPKETLYRVRLKPDVVNSLKVKVFESADIEWLDFILMCRASDGVPHDYDLVIGPTADDDTMMALRFYLDGAYGMPGSESAKRLLLQVLETENLGVQCHIGNQSVADRVVDSIEAVDWREFR